MIYVEESLAGAGGVKLHTRRAQVAEPRGAVVVLHGYGDHSGRFGGLTELFNRLGLSVFLYDQRGHGLAGGARGAVSSWNDYLDDLDLFLAQVTRWHGAPPEIIFGHSMGGLVAAGYLLARPHSFRLAVLSSPLMALAVTVGGAKLALARLASRLAPRLSLPTEVKPEMLSHDPAVSKAYAEDPQSHKVANSRWFTEMLGAQEFCLSHAAELAVAGLLVVYGEADPLVAPRGAREFFEATRVVDKECRSYPDMLHEIFNETGKETPLADLAAWLAARL
ncbi:MAG: lysophospholipase [Deltaproteobacteria bacterium]|nr:lysophospholipase [Deltaproteobacteria bacterium]